MHCRIETDDATGISRLVAKRRIKADELVLEETSTFYELFSSNISKTLTNNTVCDGLPSWVGKYFQDRAPTFPTEVIMKTSGLTLKEISRMSITHCDYLACELLCNIGGAVTPAYESILRSKAITKSEGRTVEENRLLLWTVGALTQFFTEGDQEEALRIALVLCRKSFPIKEHVLGTISFGTALFATCSHCRYSCKPNTTWTTVPVKADTGPTIRLRACRTIEEGEEILLNYGSVGDGIYPRVVASIMSRCDLGSCTSCYFTKDGNPVNEVSGASLCIKYGMMHKDMAQDEGMNTRFLQQFRSAEARQQFAKDPWTKTMILNTNLFGRWMPRPGASYRAPFHFMEDHEIKEVCDYYETTVLKLSPPSKDAFVMYRAYKKDGSEVPRDQAIASLRRDALFMKWHTPCRYQLFRSYVAFHASEEYRRSPREKTAELLLNVLRETDPFGGSCYEMYKSMCAWNDETSRRCAVMDLSVADRGILLDKDGGKARATKKVRAKRK